MKALIIGAAGFVGGYLIDELKKNLGWEVFATKLSHEEIKSGDAGIYDLDILNEQRIFELLDSIKPDIIYHLAAQTSVALSWKNPSLTIDVNVKGSLNLLESVRKSAKKPRVILIGSSEEYGIIKTENCPVSENYPPRPENVYALSKYTQNMLGAIYAKAYGLDVIMVRAFNHIGPGQSAQFVVSDFCKQAAEISAGKRAPVIYVGNLSAKRDFTDVRDIVRAYGLLGTKGKPGETYNVGSGKAVSIRDILDLIISQSDAEIEVITDKEKFRPVDVPLIEADISKLVADTGWRTEIELTGSVRDILNYFRAQYSLKS